MRQASLYSVFFAAAALFTGSAAYLIGLLVSRKGPESNEKKVRDNEALSRLIVADIDRHMHGHMLGTAVFKP